MAGGLVWMTREAQAQRCAAERSAFAPLLTMMAGTSILLYSLLLDARDAELARLRRWAVEERLCL